MMHSPESTAWKSSDAPASWALVSYQSKKEKGKPLTVLCLQETNIFLIHWIITLSQNSFSVS